MLLDKLSQSKQVRATSLFALVLKTLFNGTPALGLLAIVMQSHLVVHASALAMYFASDGMMALVAVVTSLMMNFVYRRSHQTLKHALDVSTMSSVQQCISILRNQGT
jgi:hypothetical protein